MTSTPEREPTLKDIVEQIQELRSELERSRQELKDEVGRWDERFFQFTRENLVTARTIIITAGTVITLSPVLQAFAPAIEAVVTRLMGGDGL
ncbi:hypothetical protein [Phormidium sp. FACHB-1136]|uniref:hypothetical protein n=1 Tax=Phormidium sp. FACHB-1136 TaxID=2692848 RepID=UPI001681E7BF|nr:hypothetical protein [Phormidium sp. FACHB-1136]MBD2425140.1 hypothetical protein [Phormidium sp. FACHB-1136]